MTTLTAYELVVNYPDQIMINSSEDRDGKWGIYVYRLHGEDIHKLMLSTEHVFDTKNVAMNYINKIILACFEKLSPDETEKIRKLKLSIIY